MITPPLSYISFVGIQTGAIEYSLLVEVFVEEEKKQEMLFMGEGPKAE